MPKRRLFGPILALLLLGAPPAGAQQPADNPSHIEVPITQLPSGAFADFLKTRDPVRETEELRKQWDALRKDFDKRFPDKSAFKDLLNDKGELPGLDDPKAKELIRRFLEGEHGNLWPEGMDGAPLPGLPNRELLEKWLKEPPREGNAKRPQDPPRSGGDANPANPPPSRQPPPVESGPAPPSQARPTEPSLTQTGEEWRKSLNRFLRESPLARSETIRDLGRKLRYSFTRDGEGGMDLESWLEKLPRLGSMSGLKNWMPRGLPSLRPSNRGGGLGRLGTPGVGSVESPDGGSFTGFIWVAVAAMALVLAWKLRAGRRSTGTAGTPAGWRLGPWPVDPSSVATRQDLIRAFEYLSLLIFGPAARVWNHRAIASRLGEQTSDTGGDRRDAAAHLAALYERARYAPPADPLPDADVQAARRDLCLLAGVARA